MKHKQKQSATALSTHESGSEHTRPLRTSMQGICVPCPSDTIHRQIRADAPRAVRTYVPEAWVQELRVRRSDSDIVVARHFVGALLLPRCLDG